MLVNDTICALSSSALSSSRGIVRLSGAGAWEIGRKVWVGPNWSAGGASHGSINLPVGLVPGWVYCFAGPRSYTGEDQLEFHLPGNPLLVRMLLDALLEAGARPAEPGEFTARAYFNGRMTLAEAEGVAVIVSANNEQELQAARQLLAGELSQRLRPIMDELTQTLALVELGIDFSEEDVTFLDAAALAHRLDHLERMLDGLLHESQQFERLSYEPTVVLAGRPNAGKSSLLNALARTERAVVSATPGTTRDALSAELVLQRGMVRLIDVAGLDDSRSMLDDKMRQSASSAISQADVTVLVVAADDDRPMLQLPRPVDLVVRSKSDLVVVTQADGGCYVSVRDGSGLSAMRRRLDELAFGQTSGGGALALNQRHLSAIRLAGDILRATSPELAGSAVELFAAELRRALDALGGILGQVTPDDVLGKIFSGFCIGK